MLEEYNDGYHFVKHMNDGTIYHGTDKYKGGRSHMRPPSRTKIQKGTHNAKKKANRQTKKSRRINRR